MAKIPAVTHIHVTMTGDTRDEKDPSCNPHVTMRVDTKDGNDPSCNPHICVTMEGDTRDGKDPSCNTHVTMRDDTGNLLHLSLCVASPTVTHTERSAIKYKTKELF